MNNQVKGVWITNETHQALKKHCDKSGKKIGFVVENLIKKELKKEQCQKS